MKIVISLVLLLMGASLGCAQQRSNESGVTEHHDLVDPSAHGSDANLTAAATAVNPGYVCVSGTLFMPNGEQMSIGVQNCSTARLGMTYACISGFLYHQTIQDNKTVLVKIEVGFSNCQSAKIGGGYACVGSQLFFPDKTTVVTVGTSNCQTAKVGNGYACVAGVLYQPDGSQISVGTSNCQTANLGG